MDIPAYLVYEDNNHVFHYRLHQSDGQADELGKTLISSFNHGALIENLFALGVNFWTINTPVEKAKEKELINKQYPLQILSGRAIYPSNEVKKIDARNQKGADLSKIIQECSEISRNIYIYKNNKWDLYTPKHGVMCLEEVIKLILLENVIMEKGDREKKNKKINKYLIKNNLLHVNENIIDYFAKNYGMTVRPFIEMAKRWSDANQIVKMKDIDTKKP